MASASTNPRRAPRDAALITTHCWSCDGELSKWVPRRSREHRQFAWACSTCEVTWSGPGVDAIPSPEAVPAVPAPVVT